MLIADQTRSEREERIFIFFIYFFNRMKFHTGIFSGLLIDMLVDLPPCAAGTTFVRAIQNLPKRRK